MRRQARGVARVFVEVFLENVWKPFNRAGRPEEEWPKVREALERLRPLASEALLAIFQQVMSEAVEEAAGREIRQELREPARAEEAIGASRAAAALVRAVDWRFDPPSRSRPSSLGLDVESMAHRQPAIATQPRGMVICPCREMRDLGRSSFLKDAIARTRAWS